MSVLVYHVDDEVVHFNNGAIHVSIPPQEVVEIESEFDGRQLLSQKHFHGIVEVHQVKTKGGVTYDISDAHERASEMLASKDQETIREFVEAQFEDRIKAGKPALPPGKNSRIERLAKKYGVNFKSQFGLDVVSVSAAEARQKNDAERAKLEARQDKLEAQNEELLEQNKILMKQLQDLLAAKK